MKIQDQDTRDIIIYALNFLVSNLDHDIEDDFEEEVDCLEYKIRKIINSIELPFAS
jgi:hypothetical protein